MLRYFWVFLLIAPAGLWSQEPAPIEIKRVVLYKNGIGYFELDGTVTGNREVSLSFPSGQLNDVLKTITVLDLNGGRIAGVGYASQPPVGRQLGELPLPQANDAALRDFLLALKGTRLEIKSGTSVITGRLLSVERKTRISNNMSQEVDLISLLTEAGEIRTVELGPTVNLRLLEKALTPQMDRYLDIVSSTRAADLRTMTIRTEGQGERRLFVSYISETPVWKATYRLVLGGKAGAAPLLQGWAIVDNTSGQDWKNVSLSLVAGAPQSFIQEISKPYYSRRPVVAMPESYLSAPQTHQRTLTPGGGSITGVVRDPSGAVVAGAVVRTYDAAGNVAGETTTDAAGQYVIAGLPDGFYRNEVQARGFRANQLAGLNVNQNASMSQDALLSVADTASSIAVTAAPSPMRSAARNKAGMDGAMRLGAGGSGGIGSGRGGGFGAEMASGEVSAGDFSAALESIRPSATAQTLGELFEYKLKEPITIWRNRSALVPILQSTVGAEKISLWNPGKGAAPLRSVWLNNTTGATLDGGTFAVLEDQTFAGEGLVEAIQAGEKRIVSYAVDQALTVNALSSAVPQRVTHASLVSGTLTLTRTVHEKVTYRVRNEDTQPRIVVIEHPARVGFKMLDSAVPIETTPQLFRFRLPVEPKKTAEFPVEETRLLSSRIVVGNLGRSALSGFFVENAITPELQALVTAIVEQNDKVQSARAVVQTRETERKHIFEDQERLRENMKSLKGSTEEKDLLRRYTARLNDQESRLEEVAKVLDAAEVAVKQEQAELDKLIKSSRFIGAL